MSDEKKGINPGELGLMTQLQMVALLRETGTDEQKQQIDVFLRHLYGVELHEQWPALDKQTPPDFMLRVSFDENGNVKKASHSFYGNPTVEQQALVIQFLEDAAKHRLDVLPHTREAAMALGTHVHYKGGIYREIGKVRNADDADAPDRTLYQHLFPHERSNWHRDTEEFNDTLNTGQRRFDPIKKGE
jgi:hypothetical protein